MPSSAPLLPVEQGSSRETDDGLVLLIQLCSLTWQLGLNSMVIRIGRKDTHLWTSKLCARQIDRQLSNADPGMRGINVTNIPSHQYCRIAEIAGYLGHDAVDLIACTTSIPIVIARFFLDHLINRSNYMRKCSAPQILDRRANQV